MITNKPHFNLLSWLFMAGMLISGCQSEHDTHNTHEQHEKHKEHEENQNPEKTAHPHSEASWHQLKKSLGHNEVLITQKQLTNAEIELGKVDHRELSERIKAFGEITLAPSDKATVGPLMSGIVRKINSMEGDYVNKGEVLARIEHPDIVDLQKEYLEALSRHEYLEEEYKRQKNLFADSLNAAKTFQETKSDYRQNQAKLQGLKEKLRMLHVDLDRLSGGHISKFIPLITPVSGYVTQINTNNGAFVKPGETLFMVSANKKAHLDLEIYEKDLPKIQKGQRLTFNLSNNPLADPLKGRILKISQHLDKKSRSALVHAKILEWNKNLFPGMPVTCYIQTGGNKQPVLPEGAFIKHEGQTNVFRLKKEGKHHHQQYFIFQRMHVKKSRTETGYAGVKFFNEVSDTAKFAINNTQAIFNEMQKGEGGHGHAH